MTDLFESTDPTDTSPAPIAAKATSTPFPPPAPKSLDDASLKRQRMLAIIGAIALLAAVALGLLWVSALNSRNDAVTERDAARATAAEESNRTAAALDSLAATEVDLEAARTDNEQLAAELAAAEADATEATAAMARADEAAAALGAVTRQNEELAAEIVTLETSLSEALAANEEADAASVPAEPAAFDIDASPGLARFIGEELSSSSGPSVLGQGQTTCLGTAVVNDIGLATLGEGLSSEASSSERTVVTEAIERAAVTCGIDPSAIF